MTSYPIFYTNRLLKACVQNYFNPINSHNSKAYAIIKHEIFLYKLSNSRTDITNCIHFGTAQRISGTQGDIQQICNVLIKLDLF